MALHEKIVIATGWHELLRTHGLDNIDSLHASMTAGEMLKSGRANEVRRLQVSGPVARTLYIKKYWYPTARLRWSGFYRGTFLGRSKVRTEFENLHLLREWGLDAPAAVAYGETRSGRWLHRSFVISEGVADPVSLDLFICSRLIRERRRELIRRLADLTRRMHEHQFVHHDYFWRNILLSGKSLEHFYLIDSHKGRRWRWLERRSRAKDLATLDAPAPGYFRRTERLRFFLQYRGHARLTKTDKALIRLVLCLAEPMRAAQLRRVRQAQKSSANQSPSVAQQRGP
jgi:tRNA A-37 threonylcarbamoyl transferase component Bud32